MEYGKKVRTIRKDIRAKLDDWIGSIKDEELRGAVRKDVIVTGGSIASMLIGETVKDYDVYFRTQETTKLVALYYAKEFGEKNNTFPPVVRIEDIKNIKGENESRVVIFIESKGIEYEEGYNAEKEELESLEKGKYRPVFLSQNAITLSDKMQIVIRFYGEPDKIHDNYDFVHATCYYDYREDKVHTPEQALLSLLSKTLVYRGSLYPIASIFRMKKFIERGWRIGAGQQLKIMWQISEIDLKNPEVLREQLTGVDQAYMSALITALEGVDTEKINSTYVGAIIDKIFE